MGWIPDMWNIRYAEQQPLAYGHNPAVCDCPTPATTPEEHGVRDWFSWEAQAEAKSPGGTGTSRMWSGFGPGTNDRAPHVNFEHNMYHQLQSFPGDKTKGIQWALDDGRHSTVDAGGQAIPGHPLEGRAMG